MQSSQRNFSSEIPMASEKYRLIFKEIHGLKEKRTETLEFLQQTEQRLRTFRERSKNAEATINQNLRLLNDYKTDARTKAKLCKTAARENSKLRQDIKNMNKECNDFKKYMDKTEEIMSSGTRTIENLRNRIKCAKKALAGWQQEIEQGNQDRKLKEMHFKDYQQLASERNLRRHKINSEIYQCRKKKLSDQQKMVACNLECSSNFVSE